MFMGISDKKTEPIALVGSTLIPWSTGAFEVSNLKDSTASPPFTGPNSDTNSNSQIRSMRDGFFKSSGPAKNKTSTDSLWKKSNFLNQLLSFTFRDYF